MVLLQYFTRVKKIGLKKISDFLFAFHCCDCLVNVSLCRNLVFLFFICLFGCFCFEDMPKESKKYTVGKPIHLFYISPTLNGRGEFWENMDSSLRSEWQYFQFFVVLIMFFVVFKYLCSISPKLWYTIDLYLLLTLNFSEVF